MMAPKAPYTYYLCPCTDISAPAPESYQYGFQDRPEAEADAEQTLNPHSPRADYALYPIDHLLFCDDCHELRCPRCYYEETFYYYCPKCLFETQSTFVKTESNRCNRSCFQCPVCEAPLSITTVPEPGEAPASPKPVAEDPHILSCTYCGWSTLDVGITFEKSVNISGQLAKLELSTSASTSLQPSVPESNQVDNDDILLSNKGKNNDQYSSLATFYKSQIAETNNASTFGSTSTSALDSPSFSRLLSHYGHGALKKANSKPSIMREANTPAEGLQIECPGDDRDIIDKMRTLGWSGTITPNPHLPSNPSTHLMANIRPIPTLLRSKRGKRCRTCRSQLAKMDEKRQSTRWRIRLVATNHIINITAKPLNSPNPVTPSPISALAQPQAQAQAPLAPGKSTQFLLKFTNPLFDIVKVTLATPPITPGPLASKVTILCPQFEIGANIEDYVQDALDYSNSNTNPSASNNPKHTKTSSSTYKPRPPTGPTSDSPQQQQQHQQAEAGKIWAKGSNWTSVICEIVPGIPGPEMTEQDRSLQVPVYVRMEYEADETSAEPGFSKERRVQREMAYWCVLCMGQVTRI